MIDNNIKPFGFRRNIDYIKVSFIILFKRLVEYKVNFFSAIIVQIIYLSANILFFTIFSDEFSVVVNWDKIDFILFLFLLDTLWCFAGIIIWSKSLFTEIKRGNLNQKLFRPIDVFFKYFFGNLNTNSIIMIIMNSFVIITLFIIIEVKMISLFFMLIISLLIILLHISFYLFLDSIDFIMLRLSDSVSFFVWDFNTIINTYPFKFFEKSKIKYIFMFLGGFYVGSLLVPILRGYEIWNLKLQLIVLISLIIFSSIGTLINWHYGLKKYEAYG